MEEDEVQVEKCKFVKRVRQVSASCLSSSALTSWGKSKNALSIPPQHLSSPGPDLYTFNNNLYYVGPVGGYSITNRAISDPQLKNGPALRPSTFSPLLITELKAQPVGKISRTSKLLHRKVINSLRNSRCHRWIRRNNAIFRIF